MQNSKQKQPVLKFYIRGTPPTRSSNLTCVIPRVKGSGLISFVYTSTCHWNILPIELK